MLASWLMCRPGRRLVFFFPSVVGRRREEEAGVARRRAGDGWLELAVIDEKDA